jgi:hypothetical protein
MYTSVLGVSGFRTNSTHVVTVQSQLKSLAGSALVALVLAGIPEIPGKLVLAMGICGGERPGTGKMPGAHPD